MRHAVTRIATVQVVLCFAPLFAQQTEKPATTVAHLVRLSGEPGMPNARPID
jgi:hypothetical protein